MENKKSVFIARNEHLAMIVKGLLESNGIHVLMLDHEDSAYTVLGNVELFVDPKDEEKAKAIIAENNNE